MVASSRAVQPSLISWAVAMMLIDPLIAVGA